MRTRNFFLVFLLAIALLGFQPATASTVLLSLETDKAAYAPSSTVTFAAQTIAAPNLVLQVSYRHLNKVLAKRTLDADASGRTSWTWQLPAEDNRGYLAEVIVKSGTKIVARDAIAIDASSSWAKFPRYGFLSDFSVQSENAQASVIANLNRFHINGIQFYDWQDRHDRPLQIVDGQPTSSWQDIAGRTTYLATVKNYISLAHERGMKAMNYNLIMGTYDDYQSLGVSPTWGMYDDPDHAVQAGYPLPAGWESGLKLFNPGNVDWQNYLINQERVVNEHLNFDGWHVDQLGKRYGYDYSGNSIDLAQGFASLLTRAKTSLGNELVMNAVDQYAQTEIMKTSATSFAYAELWDGNQWYGNLVSTIEKNWKLTKSHPNTVLAAYMNRALSNEVSNFNLPGVITADAAIFAAGGSHIELGEHMLSNEYFPNSNVKASETLLAKLTDYYDFSVAYENLLRGDIVATKLSPTVRGYTVSSGVSASSGTIWSISRETKDKKTKVLHLINLKQAESDAWRDADGSLPEPKLLKNLVVQFKQSSKVRGIYTASPDVNSGTPKALRFKQKNGLVTLTLPSLKYWSMLVIQQ